MNYKFLIYIWLVVLSLADVCRGSVQVNQEVITNKEKALWRGLDLNIKIVQS